MQTPALLRRSGIRENVGNSLRLHPMIKVVARFPDVVNSLDMGVPVHQVKEFAPRISLGGSISTPPYLAIALRDSCLDGQLLGPMATHGGLLRRDNQQRVEVRSDACPATTIRSSGIGSRSGTCRSCLRRFVVFPKSCSPPAPRRFTRALREARP